MSILTWSGAATGETADDRARARELHDLGSRHYNLAEYGAAIESFKAAYALVPLPGLLYNIAQAFRQQGECAQALQFYRSYLREKPDAADRAEVEDRITRMEACAAKTARPELPPTPDASVQHPEPDPSTSGEPSRWLPWTLGGAGLALAVAGASFLVHTRLELDACSPRCSSEQIDDLKRYAFAGYGTLGAGLAVAGTGLLVAILDGDREATSAQVMVAPGAGGVWVTGRF